jgi:hypothetical protein
VFDRRYRVTATQPQAAPAPSPLLLDPGTAGAR